MSSAVRVREAVDPDGPTLLALGQRMHEESRYRDLRFEPLRAGMALHRWMDSDRYRVAVAVRGGAILGAMIGAVNGWYFHTGRQANDIALYVAPEHRGGRAALLLVDDFLRWAIDQGCVEATIATSTGINPSAAARFLERTGFKPVGGVFKQRLCAVSERVQ